MLAFYLLMLENSDDAAKFERIYTKYESMMYNVAFGVTKDHYMAQTATQNAFLSVARNISTINTDIIPMLKSYLYTIAENSAIDELRKEKRKHKFCNIDDYLNLPDEYDMDTEAVRTESIKRLTKFIRSMPRYYSEVLVLNLLFNHSVTDISRKLNRKCTTVRKQLLRGKKMIKEFMENEND